MEGDLLVGFWIKNIPYLFEDGGSIENSRRIYLVSKEKFNSLKLYNNPLHVDEKSLLPSSISENTKNNFVRNYFLVKVGDRVDISKKNIRIEGDNISFSSYFELIEKYHPSLTGEKMEVTDGISTSSKTYFFVRRLPSIQKEKCQVSPSLREWITPEGYYQDRNRKWLYTFERKFSFELLCELSHEVERLLEINMREIESLGNAETFLQEGQVIYDKKPALSDCGVTWSQEDYDHLGFIREYIRYKSIQRFTETWVMLVRANNSGIFSGFQGDRLRKITVVSLAGGPGFELYCLKIFFKKYYPNIEIERLVSYDLAEAWKVYANDLGIEFKVWDSGTENGLFGGMKIDIGIISYALEMYMSEPKHIKWLSRAVNFGKIPLLFVNSRKKNLERHISDMKREGVYVYRLIPKWGNEVDDRQIVYHNGSKRFIKSGEEIDILFPNVPHQDTKPKKIWIPYGEEY